jgi:hypothetical protein
LTDLGGTGAELREASLDGTLLRALIQTPAATVQVSFDTAPEAPQRGARVRLIMQGEE